MLKNYLKVAVRNLRRWKGYAAINVFGLAVGLACFVLIALFVRDELSYDRYHAKADRIYRMVEIIEGAEESASNPLPVGAAIAETYPQFVEAAVRFFNLQAPTLALSYEPAGGPARAFNEAKFFFADSTVFDVFDFALVRGDRATALDRPNTVVLTEAAAQRYFGDADPVGKTLLFEEQHPLEVTGVLAEVPATSHFTFDFLASFSTLRSSVYAQNPGILDFNWYWNPAWTYVLLREGAAPDALEAQFPDFIAQNWPDQIKEQSHLYLQPLADIHLKSNLDFEIRPNSDDLYVYVFSLIAVFVLLTACINFMNLSTARSMSRAKEVGMRKAIGAQKGQLIGQFLSESILLSTISLVVALPLVWALLPVMNAMADKAITLNPFAVPWLWPLLAVVALGVGALSGLYPAFVLSRHEPAHVLKASGRTGTGGGASEVLRRGLVVAQFGISIALIAGTFVAANQLDYLRSARLGFDAEQVVMVPILRTPAIQQYDAIKGALLEHRGVQAVTISEDVLGSKYQTNTYLPEGFADPVQFPRMLVHDDFAKTFGIRMVAGRDYQLGRDPGPGVIINEAMVERLGWESPQDAVGRSMGPAGQNGELQRRIVGVTEDVHFASLHQPIAPFVFDRMNDGMANFFGRYLAVRITPDDVRGTLADIERTWTTFLPDRPFEYLFVDQELDQLYRAEENLSRVAGAFSILAILIACLGVFALAAYAAEQRKKEIGIRKVLGASVPGLIALLSKDFVRLVLVAFVVAAPVTYFAAQQWLGAFAYQVPVGPSPFLIAGVLALGIALATVSFHAVRAATANPTSTLRAE
ncbi:MAG: FtsX-like permease family protein [Rhodothermales bacterium]